MKTISIGVDSKRALEVLSGSVFAGQDESIRELIVNAADSIAQLPPHLQLNVQIRLVPRFLPEGESPGILEIRDSGVGMTTDDAERYLGRLFASSKQPSSGLIGQFGVGFYSCFRLCHRVEVFTRTHEATDTGTKVVYEGGEFMQIGPCPVKRRGTNVVLHLRAGFRKLLERDTLNRIVRRHCDFVRYPIFVGEDGHDMLNESTAPWDNPARREEEVRQDLMRLFRVPSPLAIFRVPYTRGQHPQIEGLLFIPKASEPHFLRLYNHRVLIKDHDEVVLSETLRAFVSGAVDIDDLPLVLSRDGIVEGAPQTKAASDRLLSVISAGLIDMAKSRRDDFSKVMSAHGGAIKAACLAHDSLFRSLAEFLPFRSSTRQSVTIPEYLRDGLGLTPQPTVIYADNPAAATGLLPLYERKGIEVLYMTDSADQSLRQSWPSSRGLIEFRPVEANPPDSPSVDSLGGGVAVNRAILETLGDLFRQETKESVLVKIQALGREAPPAILALGEEERKRIGFFHYVSLLQHENRLTELPPDLQEMARSGLLEAMVRMTDRNLILNQSTEIVRHLLELVAPTERTLPHVQSDLPPLIVRFLYGQAVLSSGLVLSNEKMAEISRNQTAFVTTLLQHAELTK